MQSKLRLQSNQGFIDFNMDFNPKKIPTFCVRGRGGVKMEYKYLFGESTAIHFHQVDC